MFKQRLLIMSVLSVFVLSVVLITGTSVTAQDEPVHVIASFSILADIAANVAGDAAVVDTLISVGSNPHAYQPSAKDVATLTDADAVLVVGVNFEEGLLPVVEESAADQLVVVSQCVPIRPVASYTTDKHEDGESHEAEDEHDHEAEMSGDCAAYYEAIKSAFGIDDHALLDGTLGPLNTLTCGGYDHEADDDHEDESEHTHEAGSCDPHVWTDPVNAGFWALAVRDTLIDLDPANESVYTANVDAYLAELAAAQTEAQSLIDLVPEDRRFIVTNHLALNYFSERFGLTLVGAVIPSGSTNSEPSVQEVIELIEVIQEYNVPAIFTETTVSEDLAQQIADETGAGIASLYTGSLSQPGGEADTYINYLLFNATQISNALK